MLRHLLTAAFISVSASALAAQARPAAKLDQYKREVQQQIDARGHFTAQIVDQIFSFGELGFQEIETSRYLVKLLTDSGFTVQTGFAGIPTSFVATWGAGKPVISLGTDIDDIPQASQWPGIACHSPMIDGAPGHGEGHNSGMAVNITAALAVRAVMQREHIPGTIRLWPGVAEELLGSKAYYVREGMFRDVDLVLFTHVGDNLSVTWGPAEGSGLVSVEFNFEGQSAHAAGAPWRGRSALDAVELMDVGWNFRREHLRLQQRSHYVIPNGGDQPNVVPPRASVWYYFRELDYPHIEELYALGDTMARAAAMMTSTRLVSERILGSAWPGHFNKVIAEVMQKNIETVGLPAWSDADQTMAKALQKELGVPDSGLARHVDSLRRPLREQDQRGGGSDDIGDVSWNVPTVTLRYPSNIPNLPGHNWANGIAMATPLAHKGATAGAKALAMTMLDFALKPELVDSAWGYFRNVQTRTVHYQPLMRPEDKPAIELNKGTMDRYRAQMATLYYNPAKYNSYLEQLNITYPMTRKADGSCPTPPPAIRP